MGALVTSRTPAKRDKREKKSKGLVPLQEVRRRLMLFREEYRGIRAIPVESIIGSADRSAQFSRKFKPRIPEQRERARQVTLAFPSGDFPPIKVYQVGEAFFVRDGHIRVAAAKELGVAFVDAEITELETDEDLSPDTEMIDVIHLEQHRRLLAETELGKARPDADLRVSRPSGYARLRESIAAHGYRLIQQRGELISREAAAGDWYDNVFWPSIQALRDSEAMEAFPRSTEADMFLWLEQRRRAILHDRRQRSLEDVAWEAAEQGISKNAVLEAEGDL
jgi:hypothetical protein